MSPVTFVTPSGAIRLPSLTAARFFAAMLVVVHHTVPATVDVPVLRDLAGIGYVGVGFFFAMSGFVLTWGARSDLPPTAFWRFRFARVWPMWALSVGLAVVLGLATGELRAGLAGFGQVLASLLLLQAWVPRQTWYFATNAVGWSLSVEAFFYAFAPGLLHRRVSRPVLVLSALLWVPVLGQVALLAIRPGQAHWGGYIVPLAGVPAFAGGFLVARLMRDDRLPHIPLAGAIVAATTLYLAITGVGPVFLSTGQFADRSAGLITTLMLPAWLLLIAALAQSDVAGRRTLDFPTLVRLGEWSFALYLLHQLVLRTGRSLGADGLPPWPGVMIAGGLVALCLGLSGTAFVYVERPLERRLRGARRSPVAPGCSSG